MIFIFVQLLVCDVTARSDQCGGERKSEEESMHALLYVIEGILVLLPTVIRTRSIPFSPVRSGPVQTKSVQYIFSIVELLESFFYVDGVGLSIAIWWLDSGTVFREDSKCVVMVLAIFGHTAGAGVCPVQADS